MIDPPFLVGFLPGLSTNVHSLSWIPVRFAHTQKMHWITGNQDSRKVAARYPTVLPLFTGSSWYITSYHPINRLVNHDPFPSPFFLVAGSYSLAMLQAHMWQSVTSTFEIPIHHVVPWRSIYLDNHAIWISIPYLFQMHWNPQSWSG